MKFTINTQAIIQLSLVATLISPFLAFAGESRDDVDLDDDGLIEINSLNDLNNIRNHLDGTALYQSSIGCPLTGCNGFELTTDLNFDTNNDAKLSDADDFWNEGLGWAPIGQLGFSPDDGFKGIFEGNHFVISNLFIHRPNLLEVGLFSYTKDAQIRNLGIGPSLKKVTGHINVGGLVGLANSSKIDNCYSLINIQASRVAGGLIGLTSGSSVKSSYATGDINVTSSVAGGLVGLSYSGDITGSYATGSITAASQAAGGLLGLARLDSSIIASYASGDVSSPEISGGLAGGGANIEASFSTGLVSGGIELVGGLIGQAENSIITKSYWAIDTSGQLISAGGTGVSLFKLRCPASANNTTCSEEVLFQEWDAYLNEEGIPYWNFSNEEQLPTLSIPSSNYSDDVDDREPQKNSGGTGYIDILFLLVFATLSSKAIIPRKFSFLNYTRTS